MEYYDREARGAILIGTFVLSGLVGRYNRKLWMRR